MAPLPSPRGKPSSAGRCHVPAWERRIVCCSAAPPHPHSLCGWRGGRCLPFQPCWVGFSPLVLGQGLKWPLPVPSVTHSLLFCPPPVLLWGRGVPTAVHSCHPQEPMQPRGGSLCSFPLQWDPGGVALFMGGCMGNPSPLFPAPSPWWCGAEPTLRGGGIRCAGQPWCLLSVFPFIVFCHGAASPPPPPRPPLLRVL